MMTDEERKHTLDDRNMGQPLLGRSRLTITIAEQYCEFLVAFVDIFRRSNFLDLSKFMSFYFVSIKMCSSSHCIIHFRSSCDLFFMGGHLFTSPKIVTSRKTNNQKIVRTSNCKLLGCGFRLCRWLPGGVEGHLRNWM